MDNGLESLGATALLWWPLRRFLRKNKTLGKPANLGKSDPMKPRQDPVSTVNLNEQNNSMRPELKQWFFCIRLGPRPSIVGPSGNVFGRHRIFAAFSRHFFFMFFVSFVFFPNEMYHFAGSLHPLGNALKSTESYWVFRVFRWSIENQSNVTCLKLFGPVFF